MYTPPPTSAGFMEDQTDPRLRVKNVKYRGEVYLVFALWVNIIFTTPRVLNCG
jgi:hypothetical protein